MTTLHKHQIFIDIKYSTGSRNQDGSEIYCHHCWFASLILNIKEGIDEWCLGEAMLVEFGKSILTAKTLKMVLKVFNKPGHIWEKWA